MYLLPNCTLIQSIRYFYRLPWLKAWLIWWHRPSKMTTTVYEREIGIGALLHTRHVSTRQATFALDCIFILLDCSWEERETARSLFQYSLLVGYSLTVRPGRVWFLITLIHNQLATNEHQRNLETFVKYRRPLKSINCFLFTELMARLLVFSVLFGLLAVLITSANILIIMLFFRRKLH